MGTRFHIVLSVVSTILVDKTTDKNICSRKTPELFVQGSVYNQVLLFHYRRSAVNSTYLNQ